VINVLGGNDRIHSEVHFCSFQHSCEPGKCAGKIFDIFDFRLKFNIGLKRIFGGSDDPHRKTMKTTKQVSGKSV